MAIHDGTAAGPGVHHRRGFLAVGGEGRLSEGMEQLEHRKLIKVLKQVAGARVRELYPVLAEALALQLGWIDAFVAENPAYLALGSDGEEQYLTMFRPDFVE
jgi:hypothetical protein